MSLKIEKVLIDESLVQYLSDRKLLAAYKKAKDYILERNYQNSALKLREPKKKGIWYFRINRQYRAHATYLDGALRIHAIDNHQK